MEDPVQALNAFLSSPDSMQRIGDMLTMLTAQDETPSPSPAPDDSGMPDLSQLLRLLPLISRLSGEDNNAALLKALRPHLKSERQKKLDEAGQWLKIAKLLPLIREMKGDDGHDA